MASRTFETEGVIFRIGEEQVFAEGRFKKTEFILLQQSEYKSKLYEDHVSFECQGEQQYQLTGVQEGNRVKVWFVIQGREAKREDLKGRYFNTLKAIKIDVLEATSPDQRAENTAQSNQQQEISSFVGENDGLSVSDGPDDLPF